MWLMYVSVGCVWFGWLLNVQMPSFSIQWIEILNVIFCVEFQTIIFGYYS